MTERSQTVQVELERGLRDYRAGRRRRIERQDETSCSDIPTHLYTEMNSWLMDDDLYSLMWL